MGPRKKGQRIVRRMKLGEEISKLNAGRASNVLFEVRGW